MQYLSPFPGFKKSQILYRREDELRHAIRNSLDQAKVRKAAERVRTAQLQLIKAFQYEWTPCVAESDTPERRATLERLEIEREFWRNLPVDAIVERFRDPSHEADKLSDMKDFL